MVGYQRWQADAEIHVKAVMQFRAMRRTMRSRLSRSFIGSVVGRWSLVVSLPSFSSFRSFQ